MLFTVHANDTILDLKTRFADLFPGLKLEFFSGHHESGEGSPQKEKLVGTIVIKDIRPDLGEVRFIIDSHLTVSELEKKFFDEAGLNIQVFRKMGAIWLETVQTDSYTLQQQMEMSAESRT
ncbi:MAG: hypothetical protein GC181_12270 [Bacteroidetes bacterium]|nr:hypothetical protein [Bacteroidota bacterium]